MEARVNSLEQLVSKMGGDKEEEDDIPMVAEIEACIAAAHKKEEVPLPPPPKGKGPQKRPESDPYTAAAVAVQQIIKRKRS